MSADKSAFDALIESVDELTKALPTEDTSAGDAKVEAAAAEGGDAEAAPGADGDGDEDDGEPMGKSFKLTLDDGTEVDAVDGTLLFKAAMDRIETIETGSVAAIGKLLGAVKNLGELVKSQGAELAALKNSGKGRKTVLTIHEKPAPVSEELRKSQDPVGMKPQEFLAKCFEMQTAGKLTGRQVATAESSINMGLQPPEDIIRVVMAPA